MSEEPPLADLPSNPSEPPVIHVSFHRRFVRSLRENFLLHTVLVVLVMVIASFVVAIQGVNENGVQNTKLTEQVQCQNRYNQINNERTRQLSDVTDAERVAENEADAALSEFIAAVVAKKPQEETTRLFIKLNKALINQQDKRAETAQERIEHPVPPPPEAFCGPVPTKSTTR